MPPEQARITLVEAGPVLFPMFKPDIRAYTEKALAKRGVEVLTGEVVASITPRRVTLKSGTELKAHTLVWGAGLQGNRARSVTRARAREGQPNRRRRRAARSRRTPRCTRSATSPRSPTQKTDQVLPQLGSVALQAGEHAGETIARKVAGKETKPFKYQRQGHDGDDRTGLGRRADARRANDERQDGLTRVGHGPPRAAADERGSREGGRRLGWSRVDAPASGRGSPSHRREEAMTRRETAMTTTVASPRPNQAESTIRAPRTSSWPSGSRATWRR